MARPREHDRDQIADELIKWAEKDDSINLNKFCAINALPPSKLSQWAKEEDAFRQSYELAKAHLAARREQWLGFGALHVKAYDICAPAYDYFLKEEKRAQAEYESELKSRTEISVTDEIKEMFSATMNQLSSLQSERRIADKSNSSDTKS
jgi:hypothetical protein